MYYLVKIRFEAEEEGGKIKKIREQHLVNATSVTEAETKTRTQFGRGISPCYVEGVSESKIMSVIE